MAKDDLTPAEKARLAELLQYTTYGQALDILALARGEWPGLYEDGTPVPWPDPADPPEEPPEPQPEP
jgi:hypothetical protein